MKNTKLNKRFNNKSNKKYTNKNVSKNKIGKNKTKKYNGIGGSLGSRGNPRTVRFGNPGNNTYGSKTIRVLEQGQSLGQLQPFNNPGYNRNNRSNISNPFTNVNLGQRRQVLRRQVQPQVQPLRQPQQEYAQSFNNPIYGSSHQTYGNRNNIESARIQHPRIQPASREPARRELAVRPNKGKKTSPEDRQLVIAKNKKFSEIDSKYNKSIADLKKNIDINVSTLRQNQSVDIYKETLDNMSNLQSLKQYLENKKLKELKEINDLESIYSELNEDIKNLKEINNSKIKYITEQTLKINTVVPVANKNEKTKILEYLKILLAKHEMFTDYLNFKLQNPEDFKEYIKPIIDKQKASLLGNPLNDEKEKLQKLLEYIKSLIKLSNTFKKLIPLDDNLELVSKYIKMIETIIINFGNKKTFRKEVKTGDELNINNFTGEDFKSKITEARAAKKKQAVETDKQKKEEAENEKQRLLTIRQDKTKGNYINNNGNVKSIDEIIDHIESQATKMDINNNKNTGFKTKFKYRTFFDLTKFTKIKKTINNEKDEVEKNIDDETMRTQIIDILSNIFKRTILTEEFIKLKKIPYTIPEIFFNYIKTSIPDLEELLQRTKTGLEQIEKKNKTPKILKLYEEDEEDEEGEEEEGVEEEGVEEDKLITYLKEKANEMLSSNIIRNKNRKPISFLSEKPFDIIKKTINNEISEITTFNKKETAIKLRLSDIFARIVIFKKIYKLTNNNPPNITIDEIFNEIRQFTINDLQIKLSDAEAAAAREAAEAAEAAKAAAEVLEKKPGFFSRALTKLSKLTKKRSASISSPQPVIPPLSSEIKIPINHYWYEGWVDHSGPFNKVKYADGTIEYFPDEIEKFKEFVDMLITDIKGNPGGTVIHCSAGVGRTGTLSVILSIELNERVEFNLLGDNKAKANYIVDKIIKFRKSRYWFVQQANQLEFIYQYFGLDFNMVSINKNFETITTNSNAYDISEGGKLMTKDEIKAITTITQSKTCNRYTDILPHKDTKVVLGDYLVSNSSIKLKINKLPCKSYINADTVDIGSGVEIIATQCPTVDTAITVNTVESFKHMLVQKDVKRIIMLTGKTENGKIKCSDYTDELLGSDTVEYGNPQTATSKVTIRELELIVNNDSVTFNLVNTHESMIISHLPIESVNNDNASIRSESVQSRTSSNASTVFDDRHSLSLSGDED
jgi:protein tyrosine phosphatase